MWLFSNVGFVSVVQKPGSTGLTLRARVREDLDRLRTEFMPELAPTIVGGGTDYPYRATIDRDAFAEGLNRLVKAITYPNFKTEVHKRLGEKRAKVYGKVWTDLLSLESKPPKASPASPRERGRSSPPEARGLKPAFGGVVFDEQGRVLLFSPKGGFGGVAWSFPKGRPDRGEAPEETARREVLEETGVEARIAGQVPGEYPGDVTLTMYYLMEGVRKAGRPSWEAEQVVWATADEARALIEKSPNPKSRSRDLAVLKAALEAR